MFPRRFVSGAVLTQEVTRLSRVASNFAVDDLKPLEVVAQLQDAKRRKQVFEESKASELSYYLPGVRCVNLTPKLHTITKLRPHQGS